MPFASVVVLSAIPVLVDVLLLVLVLAAGAVPVVVEPLADDWTDGDAQAPADPPVAVQPGGQG
jgi:hypothetical protein